VDFCTHQQTDVNILQGMGIMLYQINVLNSGNIMRPGEIYHHMKDSLHSQFEICENEEESDDEQHLDEVSDDNDENEKVDDYDHIEDEDLITGKAIEDLRRAAIFPSVTERGDLSTLFRLLSSQNSYWHPSTDKEKELINICNTEVKKIIKARDKGEEKFVKTWITNKLNKNGMKQERVLVLTESKFYTCKIVQDKVEKKITLDGKHVKGYSLKKVVVIDVARFKPSATDKKLQPYGLAVHIEKKKGSRHSTRASISFHSTPEEFDEKPLMRSSSASVIRRTSSNITDESSDPLTEEEDEDHDDDTTTSSSTDGAPKKKKKQKKAAKIFGKITKHAKKGAKKVLSGTDKPLDSQNEDDLQSRPNIDGLATQYVMAPNDIFQSDNQQVFLLEVAWCIFTAAAASQGKKNLKVLRPFQNYRLNKPSANVGALIYNKLNMGSTLK
jgi:hypothetical protein